jgi:penicillin-binding protein 1A
MMRFKSKATLILALFLAICAGATLGAFLALTEDMPQIRALEDFRPSAVTRIYSADGTLLTELFTEKRDPVPLSAVPEELKSALITIEDRKFYTHSGVDLKGILRAVLHDIQAGGFVEGASTITQQLAKTLFLTPRKNLIRKLREAILAFQLERRYTKDELLQLYLNQVYFGSGAYGVESAARIFFGKSVNALSLAQCALIAGMPKAPSRYSPLVNPDLAVSRRNIVLRQMLATGIIDDTAHRKAIEEPLALADRNEPQVIAPYFLDYIKKDLEATVGASLLYKGGLRVYTTLSYPLQQDAESAAQTGLQALEKRMAANGRSPAKTQAALVALDVKTGGVLAMVGGRDYRSNSFNRATIGRRQPGSAFKPIVYAYAVEKGFAQNKTLLDAPVVFKGALNGVDWRPENFSKTYQGEITMRKALADSENIPAIRLIEMLGPSSVVRFAQSLGIQSPLDQTLSLVLGTSEVTLMDLTSAYAVFANQGQRIKPHGILEVLDSSGRLVWRAKPEKSAVMSRAAAAVITDVLEAVILEGTGRSALVLGRPLAGKTGTTDTYRDALFVGYSPATAAGVWVGNDDAATLGPGETGARAALPIWIDFMQSALAREPMQSFGLPRDVVRLPIDPVSGLPKHAGDPDSVTAAFIKGTEPTEP